MIYHNPSMENLRQHKIISCAKHSMTINKYYQFLDFNEKNYVNVKMYDKSK